jgi:hypothetical protein
MMSPGSSVREAILRLNNRIDKPGFFAMCSNLTRTDEDSG